MKKNILIVNQPLNNRGDESAHKALVRSILRELPNSNINILFVGEDKNSIEQFKIKDKRVKYINILTFTYTNSPLKKKFYQRLIIDILFKKWLIWCLYHNVTLLWNINPIIFRIKHIIKGADKVVCAPGGICMGGFQYWPHIAYLYMAMKNKKEIYYYGRSFGPFPTATPKNRKFKEISLQLLHYFKFISIRDHKTEELAKQLGINYETTVDSAFLETPSVQIPNNINQIIKGDFMVLVPNILIWHYAYKNIPKERIIKLFLEIINIIIERNPSLKIVMLPQTFNYHDPIKDDVNFFRLLKKESKYSDQIIVLDDIYSSDIQQTIISRSKFLIGARYHSTIFAINQNIPFIALSYEHKITGLLMTLHSESNMIDISNLNTDNDINNILIKLQQQLETLQLNNNITNNAKRIALNCFKHFINIINGQ